MAISAHNIAWFNEIDKEDIAIVGGKAANLGEIINAGFPVPDGFVITSHAYYDFIRENNLSLKIKSLLATTNFNDQRSLDQTSRNIKALIHKSKISENLLKEILSAYASLGGKFSDALVAIRSSATAEDLPTASFAGQQETFLNVKGDAVVLVKVKEAWGSLFNARAIFYRHEQKLDHTKVGIALVVQKMVESEKSGVMFTIDPVTNDKKKVVIEAIYGLGELIVQGEVNPDHYEVNKENLRIINKQISYQTSLLKKVGVNNKEIKLLKNKGQKQKLSDEEIKDLAAIGKKIEKHYYFPQDLEWAIEKGKIYIVQTRAVTTTNTKAENNLKKDLSSLKLILKGDPASPGIRSGSVRIIKSAKEINKVLTGDVLVAPQTNPDYVSAMKKASAIITDSGGRTSHAAIVSRELGIPAVVGTQSATSKLKNGETVTVDGAKGEVYLGGNFFSDVQKTEQVHVKTVTKIYVNMAEPQAADRISKLNVDGIGLLRAEFMMANIGTHPKKMIKDGRRSEYIAKLALDLSLFCKAFGERPVIYRASDFKTNEYRNLTGGKDYEPLEDNPMLGFRGAFRYIHDPQVFKLELEAIKKVRNEMGYKNLWLMIPFVRTVEELAAVKKIITDADLHRSDTFKLWMMVEIPTNVILLDEFINVGIDGVSIGSNDLTMLIMGTDRDNHEVASEFNEMYPSVMWAFEHVIKTSLKHNITVSLCGQAASSYSELVKKMVFWGVTSLSVSPDAIDSTRKLVLQFEKELLRK